MKACAILVMVVMTTGMLVVMTTKIAVIMVVRVVQRRRPWPNGAEPRTCTTCALHRELCTL
jgi:hypothetical protein